MVNRMSESIQEAMQSIVEEFSFFDDWQDRYAHIIELGRESPPLDPAHKVEANLVKGCQSQVWLISRREGGHLVFEAESDALIVQGLIAILLRIYSGRTPEEILGSSPEFLKQVGLDKHLSQNRTNGLYSMLREIHRVANEAAANPA